MHQISNELLSLKTLDEILSNQQKITLSDHSKNAVVECYNYLHQKIDNSDQSFYGINTGFGSLCNIKINKEELQTLQSNLVKSHACGSGAQVPPSLVKIILLLKIN